MVLMKLTLPPFLSGRIVPKSHAGIEQRRYRHADRLDAVPPLSSPGTERGDTRLDGQTWRRRWRQRLRQWEVRPCFAGDQCAVPLRLDDQWDARHERVPGTNHRRPAGRYSSDPSLVASGDLHHALVLGDRDGSASPAQVRQEETVWSM
jgi:hypothetical protein